MAEKATVRFWRLPWWFWVTMAGLFAVLVASIAWFLGSPTFEDMVRQRVVAELQKATGGTVELQSLHWNLSKLEIEGKGLTIRGLEPATEAPLAHVDRLYIRLYIVSLLKTSIDFRQLVMEQPVVHVIVKPDGSTNVPEPRVKSTGDPLQQLFDLAIGRAELRNGTLLWNDQKLPLDFNANDVTLDMSYQRLERRYDGNLHVGKMDAQFQDLRDIPATADANFSLWRDRAQIRSLKLTSQKSSVELSGNVDDFNHPKLQLSYGGTFDLSQLADIARVRGVRAGGANIAGSGTFSQDNFATSGKLMLRGVNYEDPSLALRDVSAETEYSLDREHILLKKIDARLLGGTVTGNAEVRHYLPALETTTASAQVTSEPSARKGKAPATPPMSTAGKRGALPAQQGTAELKVSRASLSEVIRLLSSKSVPLEKLNATGAVNGTVNLTWRDSISRAIADLALDAAAPAQSGTNQLPVSGALHGRYDVHSGSLDIAQLNLATPHSEANASGLLGSRTANLKLAVTTSNLSEFQPLLSAMGQSSLPVELNGRASFNGTMSGSLEHPDIAGRLLAIDFSYVYTPAQPAAPEAKPGAVSEVRSLLHLGQATPEAKAQPQSRHIHIDSFAGDVQYGRTQMALHNGVIEQGNAHLSVDGSASLEDGSFTRNSPFTVHASIHNASVPDLQQTLGTNYPLSGTANLDLHASGTQADPHGQGQVSVTGGEAYGHPVKTFTANLVMANQEAELENIRVEALGGSLTGTVAYNLNNKQLRTDVRGEKFDLSQIAELQSAPVQEHGIASFRLKTSGPFDKPVIDAHLEVENLALNDELTGGGLVLDAVSHGDKLQLTGRSHFPQASVTLDGTVDETGNLQSDFQLQFTHVDIDPLLMAELKTRITGHSSLNGHASISGPLRQPRNLKGSMAIDTFTVELEKIPIHSDGPIELALDDQVVSVKRLTITAEDTHLSIGGTLDLKGERPLDLYAKGHLNMALFHALDDEITSYGSTDADVTIRGTLNKPDMKGRVVIAHAGFSVIDLPAALGEMNGTLVFNQNRLEVERLAGHVGGGQVNFSGYITYGSTIGFDLKSNGTDIRFRYGGVSVTADQNLRLSGTLKGSTLAGEITITRFAQIPMEFAPAFISQPVEVPNPNSPLSNLRLDVHIVSAPELTFQTSLAKLSGDADLRLRGTGTRPVLLGRINIDEGDIKLNGTKYHLDRGDVTFANPVRIDPILDMEATTRVRDFDITIGLHGTLEKLTTTYRSDPPLSSDDIIALLAFGRTQEESYAAGGTSTTNLGEGAGSLVLGQFINQAVSNRVSRLFGVSSIRINPSVGGPDNNPSARLTVEQQVSNNVTLTYITNLTQSAQQVIQFEYNINSEYTVEGIRDENGVVSFDLLIRKRKK